MGELSRLGYNMETLETYWRDCTRSIGRVSPQVSWCAHRVRYIPEQVGPEQAGPKQAGPEQAGPEQVGPKQAGWKQDGWKQ